MTDPHGGAPNPQQDPKQDSQARDLTELEGEELIEVVRQTVIDLQQMLDRLQRYVGE